MALDDHRVLLRVPLDAVHAQDVSLVGGAFARGDVGVVAGVVDHAVLLERLQDLVGGLGLKHNQKINIHRQ